MEITGRERLEFGAMEATENRDNRGIPSGKGAARAGGSSAVSFSRRPAGGTGQHMVARKDDIADFCPLLAD